MSYKLFHRIMTIFVAMFMKFLEILSYSVIQYHEEELPPGLFPPSSRAFMASMLDNGGFSS